MTMPDYMSHKPLQILNELAYEALAYLPDLSPPTITLSSISTTTYKRRYSTTKQHLKKPSKN
uniref:F-box domain-containing protein n=1 Tax=Heterorhabditis bacteriophora TaxID=37862 RepID=A0A1I7XE70_HETBA